MNTILSWLIEITQSAHSTNKDIHSCETRTLPWAFLDITNRDIFLFWCLFVSCFISCFSGYTLDLPIYLHCSAMDTLFVWDHGLIAIFRAHWLKCCPDSKSSSSGQTKNVFIIPLSRPHSAYLHWKASIWNSVSFPEICLADGIKQLGCSSWRGSACKITDLLKNRNSQWAVWWE